MGHNLQECELVLPSIKDLLEDEYPFSLALKVESKLFGKESARFGVTNKKVMKQCSYEGMTIPFNLQNSNWLLR